MPPCPVPPRSPQLTCMTRPSTCIPPLCAVSSRKTWLVRGSTEYPTGMRVSGGSHTGEGVRATVWGHGKPGPAPGKTQGRRESILGGVPRLTGFVRIIFDHQGGIFGEDGGHISALEEEGGVPGRLLWGPGWSGHLRRQGKLSFGYLLSLELNK